MSEEKKIIKHMEVLIMSMSEKMGNAGVAPTAKATAPTAKPADTVKKGGNKKSEAFKAIGAAARAQYTEDQKALEGSKQDKVAFVACLGDPARSQSRKTKGEYTGSFRVVGYRFKALEDMDVPKAPFAENCKDLLDVVQPPTMVKVKAGEEVNLNIVESAMFICRPEFAGTFSGEGKTVFVNAVCSANRKDPYPALKTTEGSIKENMIMVAEMEGQVDGKGGTAKVKPGFEDFAPLFKKTKTRRTGASGAGRQNTAVKDTAAAFRSLYNMQ